MVLGREVAPEVSHRSQVTRKVTITEPLDPDRGLHCESTVSILPQVALLSGMLSSRPTAKGTLTQLWGWPIRAGPMGDARGAVGWREVHFSGCCPGDMVSLILFCLEHTEREGERGREILSTDLQPLQVRPDIPIDSRSLQEQRTREDLLETGSIVITWNEDEMLYPPSADDGGCRLGAWPSWTWALTLNGHVGPWTRC